MCELSFDTGRVSLHASWETFQQTTQAHYRTGMNNTSIQGQLLAYDNLKDILKTLCNLLYRAQEMQQQGETSELVAKLRNLIDTSSGSPVF